MARRRVADVPDRNRPWLGDFVALDPFPDRATIFAGSSVLTTDAWGEIDLDERPGPRAALGLYAAGTRFLHRYRLLLDGERPEYSTAGTTSSDSWYAAMRKKGSTKEGHLPVGAVPGAALELRIMRRVWGGFREEWWLENHDHRPRRVRLELLLGVEIEERRRGVSARFRGVRPVRRPSGPGEAMRLRWTRDFGRRRSDPPEPRALGVPPRRGHVRRGFELAIVPMGPVRRVASRKHGSVLRVDLDLPARGAWHGALLFDFLVDRFRFDAPRDPIRLREEDAPKPDPAPRIEVAGASASAVVERARHDLDALAWTPPFAQRHFVVTAGGVPQYLGLFGRDSLLTAIQGALFGAERLPPVIDLLGALQATRSDPRRAEEPGMILHQRVPGPAAERGETPFDLYYGDLNATPLWIRALATAWRWTADRALLEAQRPTLVRCLDWLERNVEEGGGFLWDRRWKGDPLRNHGWKDSDDAIVDARGRVHAPPLAVASVQPVAHLGLLSGAALLAITGDRARATRLRALAHRMRRRFDEAFWMPLERYYALAIAPNGRKIDAVASDPGHAVATLVPRERRGLVARRLFSEDLFGGWGVRTLARSNPAYDPFSYHRGSVWPVDNATIAIGLARAGFREEANVLARAMFAAASRFSAFRLPEVFGGQPLDDAHPLPGLYPRANPLQAWSASAIAVLLQAMLGLVPAAPARAIRLSPHLPEWLPWIEIRELAIGNARISFRAFRDPAGLTRLQVLDRVGEVRVLAPAETLTEPPAKSHRQPPVVAPPEREAPVATLAPPDAP